MPSLITMDEAKRHLKIELDDADVEDDLAEKSLQATAIILDYVTNPITAWTVETVPYVVKSAIYLMLGQLHADRENADITPAIKNILRRSRDPALA